MKLKIVSFAILLALGATGAAMATSNTQRLVVCHHTHSETNPTVTIEISLNAWPAHLKHGDTLGACPTPSPTVTPTPDLTPTPTPEITPTPKPTNAPTPEKTPTTLPDVGGHGE